MRREELSRADPTFPSGRHNNAPRWEQHCGFGQNDGFSGFPNGIITATAILAKLKEPGSAAKFVANTMPEYFVTDLESDLAAGAALGSEQNDDNLSGTGDTLQTRAIVRAVTGGVFRICTQGVRPSRPHHSRKTSRSILRISASSLRAPPPGPPNRFGTKIVKIRSQNRPHGPKIGHEGVFWGIQMEGA